MGCEPHVVLEVIEDVTYQVGDDVVLLCQLVFKVLDLTLKAMNLLLESLDLSKLQHLHDHRIVSVVYCILCP